MSQPSRNFADTGISLGIPAHREKGLSFQLFPNPTSGDAVIRCARSEAGTYEIRILNGIGQVLSTQRITSGAGSGELQLELGALAPGTYFVELRNGDRIAYRKVTKIAP